jgi:hypothetical protein
MGTHLYLMHHKSVEGGLGIRGEAEGARGDEGRVAKYDIKHVFRRRNNIKV